jgi:hypothetical protein
MPMRAPTGGMPFSMCLLAAQTFAIFRSRYGGKALKPHHLPSVKNGFS